VAKNIQYKRWHDGGGEVTVKLIPLLYFLIIHAIIYVMIPMVCTLNFSKDVVGPQRGPTTSLLNKGTKHAFVRLPHVKNDG